MNKTFLLWGNRATHCATVCTLYLSILTTFLHNLSLPFTFLQLNLKSLLDIFKVLALSQNQAITMFCLWHIYFNLCLFIVGCSIFKYLPWCCNTITSHAGWRIYRSIMASKQQRQALHWKSKSSELKSIRVKKIQLKLKKQNEKANLPNLQTRPLRHQWEYILSVTHILNNIYLYILIWSYIIAAVKCRLAFTCGRKSQKVNVAKTNILCLNLNYYHFLTRVRFFLACPFFYL